MRVLEVVNRASGERLKVELEIGSLLWLRDEHGAVESVSREQIPAEHWLFMEMGVSNVDLFESR